MRAFVTLILLAAACSGAAQAPAPEVRGAPLGATPASPPAAAPEAPTGQPLDPSRVIPQEAWDAIRKVEGDPATQNLYAFEKTKDDKYYKVTFASLASYKYNYPDPEVIRNSADPSKAPEDQIPPALRRLHQQPVVIVGFMVPLDIDRTGRVKAFALTQNQAFCCYGIPPSMNELILVDMAEGASSDFYNNIPIAVYGTLDIGEEIEDGYVLSLYRMKASEVIEVTELLRRSE